MNDNIGGLGYQLSANVGDFTDGMTLSRTEMNLVRREMRNSRTDAEVLQGKLDALEKAYRSGAIELDDYHRSTVRLRSETDEAKQAAQELADQRREADQLTRRLATDEEKLAEETRKLQELKPHLSAEIYARAIADLNRRLPENIAAEKRLAMAQERRQRRERLLAAEMQRGAQIIRANETATERYEREIADLNRLLRRGAIDLRTHGRAAADARSQLNAHRSSVLSQIPVVGRFSGMINGMPPGLAAAGAAAATASVGMYAFGRSLSHVTDRVAEQMAEIDANAKIAARLGTSLDQLSAIQLGAAEVSGLDDSQVNMALQRMTRRFAEAAAGGGEAKAVIKQLGLDAKALSSQDPAMIFRRVADEVAKIKDPAEQVRVAFKLFDSEGVGLVNLLREGSQVIDEYGRTARALGKSLSEIDVAKIEAANDAAGRAHVAFDGMYNTLAADLSPAIKLTADQITSLAIKSRAMAIAISYRVGGLSNFLIRAKGHAIDFADAIIGTQSAGAGFAFDFVASNNSGEELRKLDEIRSANEQAAASRRDQLAATREASAAVAGEAAATEAAANSQEARIQTEKRLADEINNRTNAARSDAVELSRSSEQRAADAAKLAESQAREQERIREAIDSRIQRERIAVIEMRDGHVAAEVARAIADGATRPEAEKLRLLVEQTEEIRRQKNEREQAHREEQQRAQKARQAAESIAQRGEQLKASLRTPFETLVAELADAKTLFDLGAIDLDTARRAETAARNNFSRSSGFDAPRSAPTVRAGETSEYNEIRRAFQERQSRADKQAAAQLATQQAIRIAAEQTADAIQELEPQESI